MVKNTRILFYLQGKEFHKKEYKNNNNNNLK